MRGGSEIKTRDRGRDEECIDDIRKTLMWISNTKVEKTEKSGTERKQRQKSNRLGKEFKTARLRNNRGDCQGIHNEIEEEKTFLEQRHSGLRLER